MKNMFLLLLLAVLGLAGRPAAGQNLSLSVDSVLVLSDIHFAPVAYDPGNSEQKNDTLDLKLQPLERKPVSEWPAIMKASPLYSWPSNAGSATSLGTPTGNELLLATLKEMHKRHPKPKLILITGDFLGHNLTKFPAPKDSPRSRVLTKIYQYLAWQVKETFPSTVVLTCLGNNDTDGGKEYDKHPPSADFITMYANTWAPLMHLDHDAEVKFKQEFSTMGYYTYKLPGADNTMLMLNSMLFWRAQDNPLTERELEWLQTKMATTTGRVWLGMHVPPGAEIYGTTTGGTPDGCPGSAQMMWDAGTSERFFQIADKYSDRIRLMLAGHTHMDEFRVHTVTDGQQLKSASFVHVVPSIGPRSQNNPGFQVLRYDTNTLLLHDFRTYSSESCKTDPAGFCWASQQEYAFNSIYQQAPPLTATSLNSLQAAMTKQSPHWSSYAAYYGASSQTVTTRALDYYWYYWCGINARTQEEYKTCICNKGQASVPVIPNEEGQGSAKIKIKTKPARASR